MNDGLDWWEQVYGSVWSLRDLNPCLHLERAIKHVLSRPAPS
jgi:hypothetical protein